MSGIRYDGNLTTATQNVPVGASAPVYTMPYAEVTVYQYGTPPLTLASLFSDEALTMPITNPITTDSQGRFGFWIPAGVYTYTAKTANGVLIGIYNLTLTAPQGPMGTPATVAVGTVETGAPGSQAGVSNSGSASAAVFNFTIPQGPVGPTGATGPTGPPNTFSGSWSPTSTYASGQSVTYLGATGFTTSYISMQSGNTGNEPDTSPTWWQLVLGAPTTTETFVLGSTNGGSNNTGAGNSYLYGAPFTAAGQLESVSFIASAAGVVEVLILNSPDGTNFTIVDRFSVSVAVSGLSTYNSESDFTPRSVTAGQYIGLYGAGGQAFGYNTGTSINMPNFTGDAGAGSHTWGVFSGDALALSASVIQTPFASQGYVQGAISDFTTTAAVDVAIQSAVDGGATSTIGAADSSFTSTTSTTEVVMLDSPTTIAGFLTSVELCIQNSSGGSISLLVLSSTDNANFTVEQMIPVEIPASSGVDVLNLLGGSNFTEPYVQAGQYIGFYRGSAAISFCYKNAPPNNLFLGNPSSVSVGSVLALNSVGSYQVGISATVTVPPLVNQGTVDQMLSNYSTTTEMNAAIEAAVSTYVPPFAPQPRIQLWSENFAGPSLPANWAANSGTWTANAGLISPASGQGYSTFITFNQNYAIEQRTTRLSFGVLASGTILGFGANVNGDGYANSGGLVVVDGNANTLNIAAGWSAGSTPTFQSTIALGFNIATGHIYTLVITQNERQLNVTIGDPVTGVTASLSAGNNSTDASSVWGDFNVNPVIVVAAGQFKVTDLTILADSVTPKVMFMGDSITYGVGILPSQRWAQITGLQAPNSSYVVSGKPGGLSAGILSRVTNELQFVKPKNLVVLIGTNDSSNSVSPSTFAANLNSIITTAKGFGVVNVFVGTIIPLAAQQATINTYNSAILALSGATIVRFDLAMSTGNNGTTPNLALYQSDQEHPNAAGGSAMAARFLIDAPEIFD
jgi:lysophospholipase L1-like esterase